VVAVIVEWFLGVLVSVAEALLGALPSFAPPAWFSDSTSGFATIFGYAADMGVWLPVGTGFAVAVAVLTCIVIGFAIKVTRIAASFLTAGGGSAG
jgi:hypothetical protein